MGGVVCKNLTEERVISILKEHGIKQNSNDWHDYERAKRLVFQGKYYPYFDEIIPYIIKFVGV